MLKVIVVVEGGIADVAYNGSPDHVEVEIVDLDGLDWLTRDERSELWKSLDSGDSASANLALHLHGYHGWQDSLTEVAAMPNLHAELHEQTECDHSLEEVYW